MWYTSCVFRGREMKADIKNREAGLTLVEVLIVLVIVALVASLVAPRVIGYLGRSKADVANAQMASIATALELYYIDLGQYPDPEDGLVVLLEAPENMPGWRGPYFSRSDGLTDPWGNAYQYALNETGDAFTLLTYGRDGVEGGEAENADISRN